MSVKPLILEEIERIIYSRVEYQYLPKQECYMIGNPTELAQAIFDALYPSTKVFGMDLKVDPNLKSGEFRIESKGMVEKERCTCPIDEICDCGHPNTLDAPKEGSVEKEIEQSLDACDEEGWDNKQKAVYLKHKLFDPKEGSSAGGATVADVIMTYESTKWYRGECCSAYPNCVHKPLLASDAKLSAKPELVELKNSTVRVFLQRRCPRSVPLDDKEIDSLSEDICSAFGTKPSVPSIEAIIEVLRPIYMKEIDVLPKYAQAIHSLLLKGEK